MSSSSGRRRRLLLLAAATLLPACDFRLRGTPQMQFRSITLTGFAPRSPLADALRTALAQSVRLTTSTKEADVVLDALLDQREKSVVASTAAAQVREFQLRLRLTFRAHTPAGRQLIAPVELLLTRDMSYSETLALAKEQEEAELYREMQSDAVSQVLRRLSAVRLA